MWTRQSPSAWTLFTSLTCHVPLLRQFRPSDSGFPRSDSLDITHVSQTNHHPLFHQFIYLVHDGGDIGSVRQLLINVAQDTAGSIQYVSDDEFREQSIRQHGRIQLCKQIKKNPSI